METDLVDKASDLDIHWSFRIRYKVQICVEW